MISRLVNSVEEFLMGCFVNPVLCFGLGRGDIVNALQSLSSQDVAGHNDDSAQVITICSAGILLYRVHMKL